MIKNNKLEKSFGPVGSTAGLCIFIAGLIATYSYSFMGLILVLIGAFIGFTTASTLIDYEKKKVKLSNNLFGIIKIGKWINLDSHMKIGIKKSNRAWRAYSRSNRTIDIADNDFRLILYESNGKEIMPIKKADSLDSAKAELDSLCKQLGLSLI